MKHTALTGAYHHWVRTLLASAIAPREDFLRLDPLSWYRGDGRHAPPKTAPKRGEQIKNKRRRRAMRGRR